MHADTLGERLSGGTARADGRVPHVSRFGVEVGTGETLGMRSSRRGLGA
jgi:hypothetical protein